MHSDPAYLTVEEVADRLRIGHMSVRRLIANGALPAFRFGRQVRVESSAVEAYIEASRVEASS